MIHIFLPLCHLIIGALNSYSEWFKSHPERAKLYYALKDATVDLSLYLEKFKLDTQK